MGDGIPVPPIQTAAQARAETEKKIAAIKTREAEETATRSQIGNRPSAIGNYVAPAALNQNFSGSMGIGITQLCE